MLLLLLHNYNHSSKHNSSITKNDVSTIITASSLAIYDRLVADPTSSYTKPENV